MPFFTTPSGVTYAAESPKDPSDAPASQAEIDAFVAPAVQRGADLSQAMADLGGVDPLVALATLWKQAGN